MSFNYHKELYRYRSYYQKFEPVLKKPETTAYTMLVLSLFTIAFFGFFAIRPTLGTITALRKEIEDANTLDTQFDQKIESLIVAQEAYQQIQPQLATLYTRIPQGPEFSLLIHQLEEVTHTHNATISALHFQSLPLSPLSTQQATHSANQQNLRVADPFEFTISFEGEYPQLRILLSELLDVSRLIIIKQIEITKGSTSVLKMSLNLESFYLP